MATSPPLRPEGRGAGRRRRGLRHATLALLLGCSGGADACTLNALLKLPLERLLELKVAAWQASPDGAGSGLDHRCPPAAGRRHAA